MVSELFANVEHFLSQTHETGEIGMSGIVPFTLIVVGLLMGLRHSFDADHVAAVSVMLTKTENKIKQASLMGVFWGLGHTVILLVTGIIVFFLVKEIPATISASFEFVVGIMLVFLGVTTITSFKISKFLNSFFSKKKHSHPHFHEELGIVHNHEHDHSDEQSYTHGTHSNHRHGHKSFLIGMVHGLAGSGALMVVIASTIESPFLGIVFILLFGVGSISGMMAASTALGIPFSKMKNKPTLQKILRIGTATFSIAIGISLMYQIAVIDKIFSF